MKDLIALAASYGVRIVYCHIDDANGFYDVEDSAVKVDISLTPDEKRSVIAHELGHVHHGHTCGGVHNSRIERQARAYAAYLLVHPIDYAAAERVSADAFHIAEELGVTVELIDDYRAMCIQRLGERTYGRSPRGHLTNDLARALS
ncbi:ImmA/IrrE family metallo-endopeptidase [Curtobacterium sp. ISL-83]|uniref:ImmA/IrrE family metallo-endopeptidase n=1 Tax=Curtobacterium sp. ISL-83 TaxID=2819145 RepID=UPI001BECC9B4|nr:ImmA/IrrE family metallo-endopeptidase [Curtobacterium sp. ISL-83]MBT2503012.1 ImmA/IrrE family metallo-endopeptidase [Curtobacterium sp. ISL-83]